MNLTPESRICSSKVKAGWSGLASNIGLGIWSGRFWQVLAGTTVRYCKVYHEYTIQYDHEHDHDHEHEHAER